MIGVFIVEPRISYTVEDDLIAGVITTAVLSEERRPGLWQDMLRALDRGGSRNEGRHRQRLFVPGHGGPAAGGISHRRKIGDCPSRTVPAFYR